MQTITILAEQSRASIGPFPVAGQAIPGGTPRDFTVTILSADWQTIGAGVHQLEIDIQRSLDSGTTWTSIAFTVAQSGPVKGGGPFAYAVSWDGLACLARIGHVTTAVNGLENVAFAWGLSVTV